MFLRFLIIAISFLLFLGGCISNYIRLPNSAAQVYTNPDIQQALLLAAQNNILVHIPDATTREFEKSEIDQKCRQYGEPIWSEKLSVYLNEFRKRPELLTRFHVIEIVRGDKAGAHLEKDLDGAVTLSIQFVKYEDYGKVSFQTKLPCKASLAEYIGQKLIKTSYEFPDLEKLVLTLQNVPEKKDVPRFQFSNEFLTYLAERGAVFKFNHELSFEKTSQGKYVLVELFNKLAADVKEPFHQHINYWFKQINEQSTQAHLIQMFALLPDKELKSGVRVEVSGETGQKTFGESDLTYLYITYNVDSDRINWVGLQQLEQCLQGFTKDMSGFRLRKPAAGEKDSYLKPGYSCVVQNTAAK